MTKNIFWMNVLQFFKHFITTHVVRERVQDNPPTNGSKVDNQIVNRVTQNKRDRIARLKSNLSKIPAATVHKIVKFPVCPNIITLNKKFVIG